MDAQYKVEQEAFSGPLGLLLNLIENQELEITKVSLAKVTDQYVTYINTTANIPIDDIADFLVVAAKLIYLKSKALLPTLQMEEDGIDLDKQLKMYKLYLDATKRIERLIHLKNFNFAREKYPTGLIEGFNPPKKLSLERMKQIFELLIKRLEPILVLPKKQLERVVSIREKIQHIRDTVLKQATTTFCTLVGEKAGKLERIVSFLAILELVKQKIISVDQETHFSDFSISKQEGAEHLNLETNSEFI